MISSRFTKPKLIEQSELIKYQSKSIKYQSNPIEFIFFLTLIALQLVELIEDDHLFNSISIWLIWLLFRPFLMCFLTFLKVNFDLKSLYIENHLLSEPNFKNYVPNFNFAILFILAKVTHDCPYQEDWRNLHSNIEKSKIINCNAHMSSNKVLYGKLPKLSSLTQKRRLQLAGHHVIRGKELATKLLLWDLFHL